MFVFGVNSGLISFLSGFLLDDCFFYTRTCKDLIVNIRTADIIACMTFVVISSSKNIGVAKYDVLIRL